MLHHRKTRFHNPLLAFLLLTLGLATPVVVQGQTQRGPSDVVREFYKAMREHRFKEAWALTIYKSAVDGLSAEELEDLRPDFEQKAGGSPRANRNYRRADSRQHRDGLREGAHHRKHSSDNF
jgi:hypothetical protein